MRFVHFRLQNWRNFLSVDVPLRRRTFLVGPNASGKSNFLDAMRFLRDVADEQGGFQVAVARRNGVSQIRSLHARRYPDVVVEAVVDLSDSHPWAYHLAFSQDKQRRPIIRREFVRHGDQILIDRPDDHDRGDETRLRQTYLEQVNANKDFRVLQEFFAKIRYMHIVPQLVREPDRSVGKSRDPFGGDFLEQLARTPKGTLNARLGRIVDALKVAVPNLRKLELHRDSRGVPHLRGLYSHWRPNAGWQTEDQFSDGTLRLLGLLWAFLDGAEPLLLEEPELSLHAAVVRHLPSVMWDLGRRRGRQILVSTHSTDLLGDHGITPEEVLLFDPAAEGTVVRVASDIGEVKTLVEHGLSVGEAIIPRTAPSEVQQLVLLAS